MLQVEYRRQCTEKKEGLPGPKLGRPGRVGSVPIVSSNKVQTIGDAIYGPVHHLCQ